MRSRVKLWLLGHLPAVAPVGLILVFAAVGLADGAYASDVASIEEAELAEALGIIFTVLIIVVMIFLLFFGLWKGLKADRDWRHEANFYPVSVTKFVIMSFVTFGMYQIFWFLKNWNRVKDHGEESIRPAWRAVFGVFWFYALIQRINEFPPEEEDRFPLRFGGVLAILYLVLTAWGNMGTFEAGDAPPWTFAIPFVALFMPVPVVAHINKLNAANPEPMHKNSRFGPLAIIGILLGGTLLIFALADIVGLIPEV